MDYLLVALVILAVFGLFRLSRVLLKHILNKLREKYSTFGADHMLVTGLYFLLAGLLFLPAFTSILAVFNSEALTGGMILHLVLVAISIILFSIAEDLFRDFSTCAPAERWSAGRHGRYISVPLIIFWAVGSIFLSPLFYSGLTLILILFYLFAISCRAGTEDGDKKKSN